MTSPEESKIIISTLADTLKMEAKSNGTLSWAKYNISQRYHTNKTEYIDLPDFPIKNKIKIVEGLDIKNNVFGTYKKIFAYLSPLIKDVNLAENRPFRILEVAGGVGDLSLGIYKESLRSAHNSSNTSSNSGEKLEVEITGSDIVAQYNEIATEKARKKGYPVVFKSIDALDIDKEVEASFDIVITLHSLHHFTPEQLIQLSRKSQKLAKQGLFAVDGTRTVGNLLFMVITALMPSLFTFNSMYVHDALISARRMYSRKYLKKLLTLGCEDSKVECEQLSLGLNYLRVSPKN